MPTFTLSDIKVHKLVLLAHIRKACTNYAQRIRENGAKSRRRTIYSKNNKKNLITNHMTFINNYPSQICYRKIVHEMNHLQGEFEQNFWIKKNFLNT